MTNQKFAVHYIDLLNGIESSEVIRPCELRYFLRDERNNEIRILRIEQTFDDWDTMETLYEVS